MPEQNINPTPITESSNRFQHQYLVAALVLIFVSAGGAVLFTLQGLLPLQRYYFPDYVLASLALRKEGRYTFAEVVDHGRRALALPPDVAQLDRKLVLSETAVQYGRGPLTFVPRVVPTQYFYELLRANIYQGRPAEDLLGLVFSVLTWAGLGFVSAGLYLDWAHNRRRRIGIIRRGPKIVTRDEFNRALQSDGIGFEVKGPSTLREVLLAPAWRRGHLYRPLWESLPAPLLGRGMIRVPFAKESSHMLIVGATGTGKSQLLHQLLTEIQDRSDTAVIYDPDGEFLASFYNPERGDVVLNPTDARCPYWSPPMELATNEEALTLAESLFPEPQNADEKNTFFTRAPRQILARLFEYDPTPQQLVSWLEDEDKIDQLIAETQMESMLSKGAGPQRAGILSALGMALNAFRLLPEKDGVRREWCAREWSQTRQGWIFITSQETTRTIMLPLISMWLDTILLRLMTKPPAESAVRPVWFVIDELASLRKLPSLQPALTRARKYQVKTVLGFQGHSQMQEIYGREAAETIMGMPATSIFFRTKEPGAADWVSRSLGDQDIAREKVNHSIQTGLGRRRTKSYSIEVKSERAVTAAQIEGLPDLHGFVKVGNYITAFQLCLVNRASYSPAFLPRNTEGFVALAEPGPYRIRQGPDSADTQNTTAPSRESAGPAASPSAGVPPAGAQRSVASAPVDTHEALSADATADEDDLPFSSSSVDSPEQLTESLLEPDTAAPPQVQPTPTEQRPDPRGLLV